MKRILSLAILCILFTLKGHAQTTDPTPSPTPVVSAPIDVNAFIIQVVIRCQAANWPEDDFACRQFILAAGKIVLNLASSIVVQPTTTSPVVAPPVTIALPPTVPPSN